MYELLILGQLARMPMHGYMIAKIIERLLGPFRQVQWGGLYPVLNRLTNEGLIEAAEGESGEDGRARRVYSITDAGRARLRELLLDTEHHLSDYGMLFSYKVSLFSVLTAEERRHLARHYAVFSRQHVDHLERSRRHLEENVHGLAPDDLTNILTVLDHNTERWRGELAWAERLIAAAAEE